MLLKITKDKKYIYDAHNGKLVSRLITLLAPIYTSYDLYENTIPTSNNKSVSKIKQTYLIVGVMLSSLLTLLNKLFILPLNLSPYFLALFFISLVIIIKYLLNRERIKQNELYKCIENKSPVVLKYKLKDDVINTDNFLFLISAAYFSYFMALVMNLFCIYLVLTKGQFLGMTFVSFVMIFAFFEFHYNATIL